MLFDATRTTGDAKRGDNSKRRQQRGFHGRGRCIAQANLTTGESSECPLNCLKKQSMPLSDHEFLRALVSLAHHLCLLSLPQSLTT